MSDTARLEAENRYNQLEAYKECKRADELEARVREVEQQGAKAAQCGHCGHVALDEPRISDPARSCGICYRALKDERDRLAEKVRELEGKLPGKLKGERALADEQIRCFHERAEQAEATLAQAEEDCDEWKESVGVLEQRVKELEAKTP